MLFQTTSAHEELRAKIRSFAEEEIKLFSLCGRHNFVPYGGYIQISCSNYTSRIYVTQ